MRILCGTDFSAAAERAIAVAATLAGRTGDALHIVCAAGHGLQLAALPDTAQGFTSPTEARRSQVQALVGRLAALGVTVDGVLDDRPPVDALVAHASADDARLVVVGAVGHSLLARLLVGSVAERVAMLAPRPVLVVRAGEGWAAWGRGARPLRVVIGFDRGPSARRALAWGHWLASLGNVQLTVCWFVDPGVENERAGTSGVGAGVELLPATHAALVDELAQRAGDVLAGMPATLQLEVALGRVDHPLLHVARDVRADVVVIGSHQRHGLERLWEESVSRGVLHHAPMDVVVVPLADADAREARAS